MRSIKAKFKKSEKKEPFLGAFIHLARAISYKNFSRKSISKNFKNLMPKDEYLKDETKELVDYLEKLTKEPEEVIIRPKSSHVDSFKRKVRC